MTGHTRPLPAGAPIARTLRRLFGRMRDDFRQRFSPLATRHSPLDMGRWLPVMAEVLEPVMLPLYARGAKEAQASIAAQIGGRPARRGARKSLRVIAKTAAPAIEFDFNLFNPRILESVRREIFSFCQETLNTLTSDLERGLARFRAELGSGLEAGEGYTALTGRMLDIIADPYRANRAAQTEAVRAVHGGQYLADKESGVVTKKQWLASADACPQCLALNGKIVGLDEPFWVNPKGGPYAVVMYPGLHPFCMCTYLSLVADDLTSRRLAAITAQGEN